MRLILSIIRTIVSFFMPFGSTEALHFELLEYEKTVEMLIITGARGILS